MNSELNVFYEGFLLTKCFLCVAEEDETFDFNRKTLNKNPFSGDSTLYTLLFLKDDEDRSVEAVETPKIDFETVVERLNNGESVFIKRKNSNEPNIRPEPVDNFEKTFCSPIFKRK